MTNLQQMSRVVYCHEWTSVEQWVDTLYQLADLTDDEIAEVERLGDLTSPMLRGRDGGHPTGEDARESRRLAMEIWQRFIGSVRRVSRMASVF